MIANDENKLETDHDTEYRVCEPMDIHNALQFLSQKLFIDIRTEKEYKESHIAQFMNIPINSKRELVIERIENSLLDIFNGSTINIYCYSNKNSMENKSDIFWYKYIDKLLNANDSDYKFIFNILCIDYETFKKQNNYLCINGMKQYPSIIIKDKLFLGDGHDAENKEILIDLGITHILNVSYECYNKFENIKDKQLSHLKYLQCPINDGFGCKINEIFPKCIHFINDALNENDGNNLNKVLVHCFAGISRSSTIIIAYLINNRNMTFVDALKFVKDKREIIAPNQGFQKQLKVWEQNN